MTDPTFAEATARKLEEQEREITQLRLQVASREHVIRGFQHSNQSLREANTALAIEVKRLTLLVQPDAKEQG